jgi:hypothetical protein
VLLVGAALVRSDQNLVMGSSDVLGQGSGPPALADRLGHQPGPSQYEDNCSIRHRSELAIWLGHSNPCPPMNKVPGFESGNG